MARTYTISNSDVQAFLSCRLAWHYSSPIRMNLAPDRPYIPFVLGRGVHEALDHVHISGGQKTHEETFEAWVASEQPKMADLELSPELETEIHEALDLGRRVVTHYDLWLERHPAPFEIVETEFTLKAPLGVDVEGRQAYFAGRADGLALDLDGNLLLIEYKTCKSLPKFEDLALNMQALSYLAAARQYGVLPGGRPPACGVAFTHLRKKAPKPPTMLQSGALSTNKRQGTSYELYTQSLEELGLDPGDYNDMLLYLDTQCQFFARNIIMPPPEALDSIWGDLQAIATEMLDPHISIYPNPGFLPWKCATCHYKEPCASHRRGWDSAEEQVLRMSFAEREMRY